MLFYCFDAVDPFIQSDFLIHVTKDHVEVRHRVQYMLQVRLCTLVF